MKLDSISAKIVAMALIGGACFVASLLVLGLVVERQERFKDATQEIADKWSKRQDIIGPMIVGTNTTFAGNAAREVRTFVLPENLQYEVVLEPEVRSRGIFKSVVYTSVIKVSGHFLAEDVRRAVPAGQNAVFAVAITDTRGIEKQFNLSWNGISYAFEPGPGVSLDSSGLHAIVPVGYGLQNIPFSFEVQLKGSEGISIAPLGKETTLSMSSSWSAPSFVGAFLPADREVTPSGFTSQWRISSFGRSYPQVWQDDTVGFHQILSSTAGVDLRPQIDAYDMTFRSIRYAILFIVMTFAAFFLFDVLANVRIHPVQYLLIGSALALFYLLLLSLSEQIGFPAAYIIASAMTVLPITLYSAFVLKNKKRASLICGLLIVLYGYLYFVLNLEDYALLFGSLLLFIFLGLIMYATRNVDWFAMGKRKEIAEGKDIV